MDTELIEQQRLENLTDEEKHNRGWKTCSVCGELKPPELFYKAKRLHGLSYACRVCHRKAVRSYRNVPQSYAWFYRRLEKMRYHAKERGLEFTLTVEDYKAIKENSICYYCKTETDIVTIDRKDNDKGYLPDNVVGCCWLCNKIKGNTFNEEEALIIGKAIRNYYNRTKK